MQIDIISIQYSSIMTTSLSSLSKSEIPEVLLALKSYRKMLKEMGTRASTFFFTPVGKNYRAEYDSTMDIALVEEYVLSAFQKNFGVQVTAADVRMTPNSTLVSGARIFAGDDMIDVTFKHIENTLKQI